MYVPGVLWSNPIIVRNILEHLCNGDTVNFSLLNKTWNLEAKRLLKSLENTVAVIGKGPESGQVDVMGTGLRNRIQTEISDTTAPSQPLRTRNQNTCEDLIVFVGTLEGIEQSEPEKRIVPISGLHVELKVSHPETCSPIDESITNLISCKMPIQSLSIVCFGGPSNTVVVTGGRSQICNAGESNEQILEATSNQLVELSMEIPNTATLNIQQISNDVGFSRLKIFKLNVARLLPGQQYSNLLELLKNIMLRGPKLEQLHFQNFRHSKTWSRTWIENLVDSVLQGTNNALLVCPEISRQPWEFSENCLNHVAVQIFKEDSRHMDHVKHEAIMTLLRNSRMALESADLGMSTLLQILLDGISFPKLTKLSTAVNFWGLLLQHMALMDVIKSKSAWKRCFPSLKHLQVRDQVELMSESMNELLDGMLYGRNNFLESTDSSYLQVEQLTLSGNNSYSVTPSYISYFSDLCPKVKQLSLKISAPVLELIISRWKWIEHLELIFDSSHPGNLDGPLCGIHPEEVAELHGKDASFLKAVNIVPLQRPLTHLTNLKKLKFEYRNIHSVSAFFISRISAGLCFGRMPRTEIQLKVTGFVPGQETRIWDDFYRVIECFPEVKTNTEIP